MPGIQQAATPRGDEPERRAFPPSPRERWVACQCFYCCNLAARRLLFLERRASHASPHGGRIFNIAVRDMQVLQFRRTPCLVYCRAAHSWKGETCERGREREGRGSLWLAMPLAHPPLSGSRKCQKQKAAADGRVRAKQSRALL